MYRNKTILVTGSASRTGQAISRYLLQNGANVILNYRNSVEGVEETITPENENRSYPLRGDVTNPNQVLEMAEKVKKKFEKLEGLINVVGEYTECSAMKLSYDDWQWMFRSNLDSVFMMCKEFFPLLKKSGKGRVLNFAYSGADRIIASNRIAYHISNMGILSLSKTFAKEWGSHGVSCNVISPGTLANSILKDSENPEDYIPAGRFGEYEDIYPILDMIFRENSTYLTGTNFILSGGYNI